jgi:hypothetical protein
MKAFIIIRIARLGRCSHGAAFLAKSGIVFLNELLLALANNKPFIAMPTACVLCHGFGEF